MTATDRGTPLSRAVESLERTREALERNASNPTAKDWRAALDRARSRVDELRANEAER